MSILKQTIGVVVFVLIASPLWAQFANGSSPMQSMKPGKGTVCYGVAIDANTFVAPPQAYLMRKANHSARAEANIIVTYTGFSAEAQAAFQAAVDIWKTLIVSPVPIRISAVWKQLGTGVLGSASPYTYYINFDGAQKYNVWHPVALAEKIAGHELNDPSEPDIVASFNSAEGSWYTGTDGQTPSGKYDLMSVVLHEIGHGLGITHSYEKSGTSGDILSVFGVPVIYETFLENSSGQNLVKSFTSPSTGLGTQISNNALFFNSPLVKGGNSGVRGSIYAPTTYSAGSSVAHLDETKYPTGNINSLMTPFFNSAEAIHNPGPIAMGILKDMGWNDLSLQYTPLGNTETVSNDFNLVCKVSSDTLYDASSFKLNYSVNGSAITSVVMQPTGNADEFSAVLPKPTVPGQLTTYQYYFSINDNAGRTFYKPGQVWTQGTATTSQVPFSFQAGPDTKPPHITHTPVSFLKNTDTQLPITAVLTDNIGIQSAKVEYLINNVAQPDQPLVNSSDSTYSVSIPVAGLNSGDVITYRIKAVDSSVEQNVAYSPSSNYYTVNIVSLAATQISYQNNFNSATSDFFGDSFFSITTPSGFNDGAIHSQHPYPNALALNKDSLNYIYELRVPIKLKAKGAATLKYDEVVLVEPGMTGVSWPNVNFYDYVIVEGSKDGGVTWKYLVKGYDCNDQSAWLTRWNSNVDANGNSLAAGDKALFKTRTIDMTTTGFFKENDVVVIRFRLMSDQLAYGWGWAIDNLKIQIDETPPTVLHNHLDFVSSKATEFTLPIKAIDLGGLKNLSVDYSVNNGALTNIPIDVVAGQTSYPLILNLVGSGIQAGDEIEYRINATDSTGNVAVLPSSGFFKIAMLNLKTAVDSYASDFNSANSDFAGNFFGIATPSGFSDGAIHSTHPYPVGFGLNYTSDFSYVLKTPIKVSATNPRLLFSEVVIAEVASGSIKDYVVVEGSKDKGVTWKQLVSPYSANASSNWLNAYNAKLNGSATLYKTRVLDFTQGGNFQAGDSVLVRFRLFSDSTVNAWGWAIDNLSIQGTITAIEEKTDEVTLYPNPVSSDFMNVVLPSAAERASVQIVDMVGRQVASSSFDVAASEQKVFVGNIPEGIYLVRITSDRGTCVKKILISR
jgi:hypothetical protein